MRERETTRKLSLRALAVGLMFWLGVVQSVALDAKSPQSASSQVKMSAAPDNNYVGSDTCPGCHEQQFKQIEAGPHFKTTLKNGRGEPWHACESCHGPGAAHVEAGGDKSKIFTFKGVSQKEASARCMECHETNPEHATFTRSVHGRAGVGCTSCHNVHQPKEGQYLLADESRNLCYSCHQQIRGEFDKPFRHRVNEGLVKCTDCHNVHSAANRQLRSASTQDTVCFNCHSDKKGPFVFEHAAVKAEGCQSCHTPHGSTHPRLLSRPTVNSMCFECHTGIPNGPHPQNTRSQACTMCHSQIHGSNASNVFFK